MDGCLIPLMYNFTSLTVFFCIVQLTEMIVQINLVKMSPVKYRYSHLDTIYNNVLCESYTVGTYSAGMVSVL